MPSLSYESYKVVVPLNLYGLTSPSPSVKLKDVCIKRALVNLCGLESLSYKGVYIKKRKTIRQKKNKKKKPGVKIKL